MSSLRRCAAPGDPSLVAEALKAGLSYLDRFAGVRARLARAEGPLVR